MEKIMVAKLKTKGKILALCASAIASSAFLIDGLATPVSASEVTRYYQQSSIDSTSRLKDKLPQPIINKIVVATKIVIGAGILIGTGVSIKYDKKFKNRLQF